MNIMILAGGKGEKMWPYNEIRNKCMMPVSNQPTIQYLVNHLKEICDHEIFILGHHFMDEMKHLFRNEKGVHVIQIPETNGNAETLLHHVSDKDFIVLYGDCIISKNDLKALLESSVDTILLGKARDHCHHHIIANMNEHHITSFIGHPRGYEEGYFMVGAHFDDKIYRYLANNRGRFKNTKVGIGSPNEKFIEESLNDFVEDYDLKYIQCKDIVANLDKPWQVLEANAYMNRLRTSALTQNTLAEGASIDPSACIEGFVSLGRNSRIGRNVHIKGNVIIGDDTIIDQGAVIEKGCVNGNNCKVLNHCKLGSYTTIGHDCIIEQTAEIIGGMIMDKNYLYHHGEFFGLCGERCDLGAGSICGTLRFDDGETVQTINTRKEIPAAFSNATYLGDYTRAGVGVIFLPGVMVGAHCVVGAGTILNKNVKSNTLIYPKQELIEKEWSYKKYGW